MEETLTGGCATPAEPARNNDDDRISKLPEDVLRRIISFLPTKSAVATSILARPWKNLYTSNPNLDFADDSSASFAEFVTKLLRSNNAPTIQSLRLSCGARHGQSTINSWISSALSRNLRKLDISTPLHDYFIFDLSQFCSSTLKTLEVLDFRGGEFPEIPESVVLRSLRTIFLNDVGVGVETRGSEAKALASYFRSCPLLEEFTMNECSLCSLKVFRVCHAKLKKFAIYYCDGYYSLVFDTPNLQHLEFYATHRKQDYVVKNTESLVTAGFRFQLMSKAPSPSFANIAKFINQMHKVSSLHLSMFALYVVYSSNCPLATFENVTFLEFDTLNSEGRLFFEDLLESFPRLEVLAFYMGFADYDESKKDKFELRLPKTKPACLSKTFRELRIGAFQGRECEVKVVKYFLTNGDVLRRVMLGSGVHLMSPFGFARMQWTKWEDLEMDQECVTRTSETLAGVPASSNTCQIVLSWTEDGKPCRKIIN